jgi:hypothetical protein
MRSRRRGAGGEHRSEIGIDYALPPQTQAVVARQLRKPATLFTRAAIPHVPDTRDTTCPLIRGRGCNRYYPITARDGRWAILLTARITVQVAAGRQAGRFRSTCHQMRRSPHMP